MARPRMDELKATEESGYDFVTGKPGGNGGNPELDPWRAWAFDVSYEKYFAENKGYVSTAAFYKDLTSYIYKQTTDGYDSRTCARRRPTTLFPPGVTKQCTGNFTRRSMARVDICGAWSLRPRYSFDLFADALDGFGAILSYSYTKSDIEVQGTVSAVATENIPLPGLSEDVGTPRCTTKNTASAPASRRVIARSTSVKSQISLTTERLRFVDSDMITDAQVSYLFGDGTLEGLQILFQVNNLTNEPYIAYSEDKSALMDYQEYGTQYLLGLNYRF